MSFRALYIFFVFLFFLTPVVASQDYYQNENSLYKVSKDGSALVKMNVTVLGPQKYVKVQLGIIKKNGLNYYKKELTEAFERRMKRRGYGVKWVNVSVKYTNFSIIVFYTANITNFSRYYSYDNRWEITLDPLHITEIGLLNFSRLKGTMDWNGTILVELPKGSVVLEIPKNFSRRVGESFLLVWSRRVGNSVLVHSRVHITGGLNIEDVNRLFGKPRAFIITYRGFEGRESYLRWVKKVLLNVTVYPDRTVLDKVVEYVSPESYLEELKSRIRVEGVQTREKVELNALKRIYETEGVKVLDGHVKILEVNGSGPLKMVYHVVVENTAQTETYTFTPRLGLENLTFLHRIMAEFDYSAIVKIELKSGKFISIPKGFNVEENGTYFRLKVKREGSLVILNEIDHVRYGTLYEDYERIIQRVPATVSVSYTVTSPSTCGPAIILLLVLLPLLRKY